MEVEIKKVLISGASGFIGSALHSFLEKKGMQVSTLVRRNPVTQQEIFWNPEEGIIDKSALEGFDAIVNLSGAPIADRLWTKKRRKIIEESRVVTTKLLVKTINSLNNPPKVFFSSSAVGYYGEALQPTDEKGPIGQGFLSEVCQLWEDEAKKVQGPRLVIGRFGLVLSPKGGIFRKVLPLFRCHIGGALGKKNRLLSVIALEDVLEFVYALLEDESASGIYNITMPAPTENEVFEKELMSALKKKIFIRIPYKIMECCLGNQGKELFYNTNILSTKFPKGFYWKYPTIKDYFLYFS